MPPPLDQSAKGYLLPGGSARGGVRGSIRQANATGLGHRAILDQGRRAGLLGDGQSRPKPLNHRSSRSLRQTPNNVRPRDAMSLEREHGRRLLDENLPADRRQAGRQALRQGVRRHRRAHRQRLRRRCRPCDGSSADGTVSGDPGRGHRGGQGFRNPGRRRRDRHDAEAGTGLLPRSSEPSDATMPSAATVPPASTARSWAARASASWRRSVSARPSR